MKQKTQIPLIVSFGGVNAAGRSSGHHGFRRMIMESLPEQDRLEMIAGLAIMMGLLVFDGENYQDHSGYSVEFAEIEQRYGDIVVAGTLVRRIQEHYFDPLNVVGHSEVDINSNEPISFMLPLKNLPNPTPENWQVESIDERNVRVILVGELSVKINSTRKMAVSSAGQLPSGFDPASTYNSRYHPKGLALTVLAAADAINALGIEWEQVKKSVNPDQIAVYASSLLGQMDGNGFAGVLQSRLKAKRVSSKQLALGFNSMPADFVNAYISGTVGSTGSMTGACASFLYNLRLGMDDIRSGRRRVVIVGCSEAPVNPEVMEGFDAMSALGRDDNILKLDRAFRADGMEYDGRRASRPFGENAGFTIAESAQYVILMDDALTLELGADIHGAIGDVFVNADGFKKSISSPGPGNYITMAKAVASAKAIVGEDALKNHSFVQAHGSSTPQNRVTESVILDKVAEAFDIEKWPVCGVKSYVGHSLAPASGDQLVSALGVFKYGILPGIKTIEKIADDVNNNRLDIALKDKEIDKPQVAFLNSKGFGGNNATATILSPVVVEEILKKRYSVEQLNDYTGKRTMVRQNSNEYDQAFCQGDYRVIYAFGENLVDEQGIKIDNEKMTIPGYDSAIDLKLENPYA